MGDFLLYEVWGETIVFNIPAFAFSLLLGYYLAKKYAKDRDLSKKKVYVITGILTVIFFLVLKSLMI